ncbi:MAG: hypothetical protein H0X30_15910 [Anaerolineae bacterium]|nr:hypothetical protein [Anaerolineae bacterium]
MAASELETYQIGDKEYVTLYDAAYLAKDAAGRATGTNRIRQVRAGAD